MFKKHYNIATEGVRAGHKLLSKLGFGFEIEIIVTPIGIGGGGGGRLIPDPTEYRITIRIRRKGRVWEQSYITGIVGLSSLERVVAVFKRVERVLDKITLAVSHPIISVKSVWIKIQRKDK